MLEKLNASEYSVQQYTGRMHNNVLVYARSSGYVGNDKTETNRQS